MPARYEASRSDGAPAELIAASLLVVGELGAEPHCSSVPCDGAFKIGLVDVAPDGVCDGQYMGLTSLCPYIA